MKIRSRVPEIRGFETSQENTCNTHRFDKPPALIVDKKFCEELIAYFP
jgi:hypothetical protein